MTTTPGASLGGFNSSLPYITGTSPQNMTENLINALGDGSDEAFMSVMSNYAGFEYQLGASNPYEAALSLTQVEIDSPLFPDTEEVEIDPNDPVAHHASVLEAGDLDGSGVFGDTDEEFALDLVASDILGNGQVDGRINFFEDMEPRAMLESEADIEAFADIIQQVRAEYVAE